MSSFFHNEFGDNWDLEQAQEDFETCSRRLKKAIDDNKDPEWIAKKREKLELARKAVEHFSE